MRIGQYFLGVVAALALSVAPAVSQAADGWSGEGALSAGFTTGNSETTDVGASLKAARQMGVWRARAELGADYGETASKVTRNRYLVAGQLDRDLSDRLFVFGRASYEADEFSGFDSRIFAGVGVGYKVIVSEKTNWTVEGGPGFRWDELTNGKSEESVSARAASAFKHQFNDNVAFTNDTVVNYAEVSTQVLNIAAITAKLSDKLSARASFEIRNESEPGVGKKATDTATRLSLVYGF